MSIYLYGNKIILYLVLSFLYCSRLDLIDDIDDDKEYKFGPNELTGAYHITPLAYEKNQYVN